MIRLTYIHWSTGEKGAMLLNPTATLAISPAERNGVPYSQVAVQGYSYSVTETIDEIEALITGRVTIDHAPALTSPPDTDESIPAGIFFQFSEDNFISASTGESCGGDFYRKWRPRWREFPPTASALTVKDGTGGAA